MSAEQSNKAAAAASADASITYLSGERASKIDEELMGSSVGYTLEQLMELAGLACAQAVQSVYPPSADGRTPRVLVVCGPGNNGGDGLVAARHLRLFGYSAVTVLYPKPAKKDIYKALQQQLAAHSVPVLDTWSEDKDQQPQLIVDAIFGFSFDPSNGIREPYKSIIERMVKAQSSTPVASIDVPSGWDVSAGDSAHTGLLPSLLISLTAPKECARGFKGRHMLGGRFVPEAMLQRLDIRLPAYQGAQQIQDISSRQN